MLVGQLEALINSVRNRHPATGREAALSPEVAVLANVYGRLIYFGLNDTEQLRLSVREQEVISQCLTFL